MDRSTKIAVGIAAVGTIVCAVLSFVYFGGSYFEPDTASYLFQAKLFAQGRLWAEPPPDFGFSPSPHINIVDGKWYSKYPFGNAFALTPFAVAGVPWLMPALATGAALLLLFWIARDAYGAGVALLACSLGMVSPGTLGIGATWFSEPVSRFCLAAFILGLLRVLRSGDEPRRRTFALVSGTTLGYAFSTRPLTAIAFGVAGGIYALYGLWRTSRRREVAVALAWFHLPFAAMMCLHLGWNTVMTGDPLQGTHGRLQQHDGLGFGRRTEGYDPNVEGARRFTPSYALTRLWRNIIPGVSFNALGWGTYTPNLLSSAVRASQSIVAGVLIQSPSDKNWVTLKLWGHGDGSSQLQYQTRGSEAGPGLTGAVPGFSANGGRTTVWLRLVKDGDRYTAFYRSAPNDDWNTVGTTEIALKGPLRVGLYSGVTDSDGSLDVSFSDTLVADGSAGVEGSRVEPDAIASSWQWSRKPVEWEVRGDALQVTAPVNADLFTDDTAATVYRVLESDLASIETRIDADWRLPGPPFPPLAILLILPLALMLLPLAHSSRSRTDVLFAGVLVACLVVYFFFYFEGLTWGMTPVSARYYNEATLLGMIPLIARGASIAYVWLRGYQRRSAPVVAAVALALLTWNTVATYIAIAAPYQHWSSVYQRLPRLVREAGLHRAVVFVPGTRDAPLGDYPFTDLGDADVVYYKLGPAPEWRLTHSDWESVYRAYFAGRTPYLYQASELARLTPPTNGSEPRTRP